MCLYDFNKRVNIKKMAKNVIIRLSFYIYIYKNTKIVFTISLDEYVI